MAACKLRSEPVRWHRTLGISFRPSTPPPHSLAHTPQLCLPVVIHFLASRRSRPLLGTWAIQKRMPATNKQPDIDTLVAHKVIEKKKREGGHAAASASRILTACTLAAGLRLLVANFNLKTQFAWVASDGVPERPFICFRKWNKQERKHISLQKWRIPNTGNPFFLNDLLTDTNKNVRSCVKVQWKLKSHLSGRSFPPTVEGTRTRSHPPGRCRFHPEHRDWRHTRPNLRKHTLQVNPRRPPRQEVFDFS